MIASLDTPYTPYPAFSCLPLSLLQRADLCKTSPCLHVNRWDDNLGIFVNRFSSDHANGTFYEHVSPTSFYALQANAATDEQAASMMEHW